MTNFEMSRKFIENEFQNASYDKSTGMEASELLEKLREMNAAHTDEQRQIMCAQAYAYLLDNVQLEINEHTPFAVKMNFGIDYTYFATNSVYMTGIFDSQDNKIRQAKLPEESKFHQELAKVGLDWMGVDFTHTVPNWPYLLENGFAGIIKNAKASKERFLASGDYKESQILFLDSVIICFEAIVRLLERVYTYSLKFNVPEFSACIKNLISNPPQTVYEVMQFSVLYIYFEELGVERGRTLGPIDTMYFPYYKKDLENCVTLDEIKDLFRYYFMHFTATKRFAQQPLTIGGSDEYGNDTSNELTHLILDVYNELNIYDPKIHIKCNKNTDEKLLIKAASMIRGGNNSLCLLNDEIVYQGYERLGVPRTDAKHYVILGCYEPIIMGLEEGEISAMRFNTVKCVEFALNGGKDIMEGIQIGYESPTDIKTFEEFFDIFLKQLDYCTDFGLDFIEKQGDYSLLMNPSPIYSASFSECIEKGMDVHEYPLKYNNISLKHHGYATTVDSLMAIKKYVYDTKEISLEDLRTALVNDWQGFEELQRKIVADREKYGNNLEEPDKILADITTHVGERYCGRDLKRGGKVRLGLDSVYHCINHGKKTSATPDGRNAGKPISKNLCATDGMDKGGITAYMQSVLKIDPTYYVDGVPFDFIMHPSAVEGEKGLADFVSLIKIFLANGGFALQGNIVSGETLKAAQRNPEKYSTLQVRVCGWNEYFVKLSKLKQDMFIKQCEVL